MRNDALKPCAAEEKRCSDIYIERCAGTCAETLRQCMARYLLDLCRRMKDRRQGTFDTPGGLF